MKNLPVIVTRAEPGAHETAERLRKLGFEVCVSPAIHLAADPEIDLPDLDTITDLVFTSANGIRFFRERSNAAHHTTWCVGPATASAARDSRFQKVMESSGNAEDLVEFILKRSERSCGAILHVANAAAKGVLKRQLEAAGRKVLFCPLYRAVPATRLDDCAYRLLKTRQPAALLVHSEKGAEGFLNLVPDRCLSHLTGIAISPTVSQVLRRAGLDKVHVAKAPNETELLNMLNQVCA